MLYAVLLVVCFTVVREPGPFDQPWEPEQEVCYATDIIDSRRFESYKACTAEAKRFGKDAYRHRFFVLQAMLTLGREPSEVRYECEQRFGVI